MFVFAGAGKNVAGSAGPIVSRHHTLAAVSFQVIRSRWFGRRTSNSERRTANAEQWQSNPFNPAGELDGHRQGFDGSQGDGGVVFVVRVVEMDQHGAFAAEALQEMLL